MKAYLQHPQQDQNLQDLEASVVLIINCTEGNLSALVVLTILWRYTNSTTLITNSPSELSIEKRKMVADDNPTDT